MFWLKNKKNHFYQKALVTIQCSNEKCCAVTVFSGKNPVWPGEVSTIEIPRSQPDLGISIVGGCDTPLVRYET